MMSFLQPGIAVLSFALMVICLMIYFTRIRIKNDISIRMKNSIRLIREIDQTVNYMIEASKSYSIDDPEPYGEITHELAGRLVDLQMKLQSIRTSYSDLRSMFERLQNVNWVLRFINIISWVQLRIRVLDFGDEINDIKSQIPPLVSLLDQLDGLTWAVSRDANDLIIYVRAILGDLKDLSEKGLSGKKYEEMVNSLTQWETTFYSRIPVFFLSESQSTVESQSSREFISNTFKFIKNMSFVVNEIGKEVKQCSSAFTSIEEMQVICHQRISDTEKVIAALENHPLHPVRWDISRESFQKLVVDFSHYKHDQKFTYESLLEQSESLTVLLDKLEQVRSSCISFQDQFSKLLTIIEEISNLESLDWARKSITQLDRAKKYDPANWPKQHSPSYIDERLRSLISLQAKNLPRRVEGGFLESQLPGLLGYLLTIRDETIELKPIFQNFLQRLNEIDEISQLIQENLGKSLVGLNQAQAVAASNKLLQGEVGSEINSLLTQTRQLQDSLLNYAKDTVHSKAKKVEGQLQKNHQAMVRWAIKLLQYIDNKKNQLSSELNVLQDLLTLDDPVFLDIINLLHDSPEKESEKDTKENLLRLSELELANFLRKESTLWERWIAAESAIREIAEPVLASYRKFDKVRVLTQASMSLAEDVVPESQEWPPTTQRLSIERLKFVELEQQSENLKREKNKAIMLVGRIGDLTLQYQDLNSQVTRVIGLAKQEQGKIVELEKRLDESKSMWNKRAHEHRSNSSANDQITELLSMVDGDLLEIKNRYKKGIIHYQQAQQALRLICRNIDEAIIPVGNHISIDITGERHREI